MNEWCFKARRQHRSYWAHLHIKHQCKVEITYILATTKDKHDKWGKEQNTKGYPFCCLLRHACCHVCSARWNGRCVDRRTAVVYSYTPIKPHGVLQANRFPFHTLFTSRNKHRIWNKELPNLLLSYELRGKQMFVSDFSGLLRHAIKKGRGPILLQWKTPGPHRDYVTRLQ